MKKLRMLTIPIAVLMAASCGRSYDTRGLSVEQMEELAETAYIERHFNEAAQLYTEMLFTYPGASNTDMYIYRLGCAEAGRRIWADAEFYLWRVVNEFPRSIWADDAQLMLVRTLWMQKRDYRKDLTPVLEASDELDYFFLNFPGSELSGEALALQDSMYNYLSRRALFTGQFYGRRAKYDAAILYLREALDDYGQTACRGEVLIALADVYRETDNRYSARIFYQMALDECDLTEEQVEAANEGLEAVQR